MTSALEIAIVSTPLEFAQAAVVLGEQRAWVEALIGRELVEVQPSSRREYAQLASFYGAPDGQLLLARLDAEPVGVVGVRRIDDHLGEGKRLFVRRSARGLGVGRRLVDDLLELSEWLGFRSLYVETSPQHMPLSYELCRRLGFRETAKRGLEELEDVVAMQLELGFRARRNAA